MKYSPESSELDTDIYGPLAAPPPAETAGIARLRLARGTGWSTWLTIGDGFPISDAKYLSLLQWHSIAKPACDIMKSNI
jgi:hypothetical protein